MKFINCYIVKQLYALLLGLTRLVSDTNDGQSKYAFFLFNHSP